MKIDQRIGSVLEGWLLRDTPGCDFCNERIDGEGVTKGKLEFCDEECHEDWETVFEARTTIGERDLRQRGFD